jgi:hypothetical protein
MLDALTVTEAEAARLSELAALDLSMARDFAARAQAVEDPESANDLACSYQRMARSYPPVPGAEGAAGQRDRA